MYLPWECCYTHSLTPVLSCRFYTVKDITYLKRDAGAIRDVLASSDMYLSVVKAQEAFVRVYDIIECMALKTEDLIALHKSVPDGEVPLGFKYIVREDVLSVLTHRKEREASKYLKESTSMQKVQGHSRMKKLKNMFKRNQSLDK